MENNKLKEAMGEKTLKSKVFEALGEVSMCWSETPKGVFDSTRAEEIGNRLMEDIRESTTNYSINMEAFPQTSEDLVKLLGKQNIQIVKSKPSVKEAIEVLCNALREDTSEGSYYYSWQANIAMAFQDEFNRQMNEKENFTKYLFTENGLHNISNEASKNFLNLLIK